MRPVTITVVTPTHGRAEMVGRLLASLSGAIAAFADVGGVAEIVIVDSSQGEDARRIGALAGRYGAEFVRSRNDVRHKRNLGVQRASGDVVLFVDSDCEVHRSLLVEHAAGYRVLEAPDGRPVGAVLGIVALFGRPSAPWRAAEAAGFCDSFSFAARYPQVDWGACANISYRRAVLLDVGGFREAWPRRLGGDDVELGLRVNAAGYAILSRPAAVVHHDRATWSRWRAVVERAWRWGAMDIHVRAAVPPDRLRPAGAGPELVIVAGTALAIGRAIRGGNVRSLGGVPVAAAAALLCESPWRRPVHIAAAGDALRLLFGLGAVTESLRRARPVLAVQGLHPVDRTTAQRRARRRTLRTAGALLTSVLVARNCR
jgi:hypothetical protein